MSTRRTELARRLAEIDQLLGEAESIAEDSQGDDRAEALELLAEFQVWRQSVEARLRSRL
jgi:hypothetical protein